MNVSCPEIQVRETNSTPGFMEKMRKILVSDYDGTITDKDFYSLLAERYIPADTPDYFTQIPGRSDHSFRSNVSVLRVCAYGGTAP